MNLLITGVGGQGTVTLGDLIAERAMGLGLPISVFHSRGMAHRGGRVAAEIRIASAARRAARPAPVPRRGGRAARHGDRGVDQLPALSEGRAGWRC